jgi:hypothetical protein
MPLSKTIEVNNTGINATYWVLDNINFSLLGGTVWATLRGYKDSAAFSGGKGYLTDRSFTAPTPGTFATMNGAAMVTAVYTYIKTQPEFTGATDAA